MASLPHALTPLRSGLSGFTQPSGTTGGGAHERARRTGPTDTRLIPALYFSAAFFAMPGALFAAPTPYNHHIHLFSNNDFKSEHAVEMDYTFVTTSKPEDAEYSNLKLIKEHNAKVCPVRVFEEKSSGKLYVAYHGWFEQRGTDRNPIAEFNQLIRTNWVKYPLALGDLNVIKGYCAAKSATDDLTVQNLTMPLLAERFHTAWPTEDNQFKAFNLLANWESRKVVQDLVAASTVAFPWEKYQAMFFDSLGEVKDIATSNANYGGMGSYATWNEGQLGFVKAVTDYARDIGLTKQAEPYRVFGNIWDPLGRQRTVLAWYGSGALRLDHYYHESGGVGKQAPNGVVPGTTQPAYVSAFDPMDYLPADRVALDDVYGYNKELDTFDREEHFLQHLDAAGTAGKFGAWFGWYGEDYLERRDKDGKLIYTNDLQLLRALPNWDNLADVPIPPFNSPSPDQERRWNGEVYESPNSYASASVVYSRRPSTNELYVVFRSVDGTVTLRDGEQVKEARLVDDLFRKTTEDALPALIVGPGTIKLASSAGHLLKRGIRITLEASDPPVTVIPVAAPTSLRMR